MSRRLFPLVAAGVIVLGTSVCHVAGKPRGGGSGGGSKPPAGSSAGTNAAPPTTSPGPGNSQASQALTDLKAAETIVEETFETSSEWLSGQAAVKQAQTDYDNACGPVMDNLKLEPAYKSALDEQSKADANLKDLQTTGSADQISDAAQTAIQARSTLKGMESKALLADPTTVAAKQKLTAANAAFAQLHQKEQDAVHADPTWQAAKKRLDAARGK